MNRNGLYLVIGVLVVVVAIVGFYLYREQNKAGIEVEVDGNGLSVETN